MKKLMFEIVMQNAFQNNFLLENVLKQYFFYIYFYFLCRHIKIIRKY
jgi:hypothetical protein